MSSAPTNASSTPQQGSPTSPEPGPDGWKATKERLRAFFLRTEVDGWVRFTAWGSLVANCLLILTGGLVRLTGSGLGCPTWPRCTEASWTSTTEMGIHGAIEFGNRLLTFVLAAVAIAAFLAVWRMRGQRQDFFFLTLILGLGIPLQAIVGGITVLTGLNPWIVGIHFMISAVMIYLAAIYVNRVRRASLSRVARLEAPGQVPEAKNVMRTSAVLLAGLTLVVVYLGTLVTGTGPHSGDSGDVVRHTFDAINITRAHVLPVYLVLALIAVSLVIGRTRWPRPVWNSYALVGAVVIFQGMVGFYQYFNGLPMVAVTLHLVGSALMVATVAFAVERAFAVTADPNMVPTSSLTDPVR